MKSHIWYYLPFTYLIQIPLIGTFTHPAQTPYIQLPTLSHKQNPNSFRVVAGSLQKSVGEAVAFQVGGLLAIILSNAVFFPVFVCGFAAST